MSSFHIGEIHVKADQKQNLLDSFKMLTEQPGFIKHEVYQSDEDENFLTTVEEWTGPDDHKKFTESLPEGAMDAWVAMLSQPPKISRFTKLG